MKRFNHLIVCLDLTQMDQTLIRYSKFLAHKLQASTVQFLHIIETDTIQKDLNLIFPELRSMEDLELKLQERLRKKIDQLIDDPNFKSEVFVKQGNATLAIIEFIKTMNPDLLIMGQKQGFQGEGVMAKQIVKYVPSSVLFVSENSSFALETIVLPVDFSKTAGEAIKTAQEMTSNDGKVVGEHIFEVPPNFFPYLPTQDEKKRITAHLEKKRTQFLNSLNVSEPIEIHIEMQSNESVAQLTYRKIVEQNADLLLIPLKEVGDFQSLLKEDVSHKYLHYHFAIPVLFLKNKKAHLKLFNQTFNQKKGG